MVELMSKVEPADRTPYVVVAFQECERMSGLISEIRYLLQPQCCLEAKSNNMPACFRSTLKTLDLGLKGELTITAEMESLGNSLFLDQVPDSWSKKAYPSLAGLSAWYIIQYILRFFLYINLIYHSHQSMNYINLLRIERLPYSIPLIRS